MIRTQTVRRQHAGLRRRQKWLLTLLTAIALGLAMIRLGPRFARETTADLVVEQDAPDAVMQCEAEVFLDSRREWPLELHRDLFRWEDLFEQPLAHDAPAPGDLEREAAEAIELQGVMLGKTPRALINGELRQEGDSVGGFRIRRIEARRVIVEKNGVAVQLAL